MGNYLSISNFVGGCLAIYVVKKLVSIGTARPPLPPGPKGFPLVGNIHDLPDPAGKPWLHWRKHKDLYGPISSVTVLGRTIIVLNGYDTAVELLKKDNCADRPSFPFGGEMVGWENSVSLARYGDRLRQYRRNFHQFLGTKAAVSGLIPLLEVETRRFLYRVMRNPSSLHEQIRRTTGAIILKFSHGYTVGAEGPDRLVDLAGDSLEEFMLSTAPGYWAVDVMPFLRYVPSWFPGAGFKRTARKWRNHAHEFVERPYAFVKDQMARGTARPSFVSMLLEKAESHYDESCIKWSAAGVYGGGADTTSSALYTFFLVMTLYPEVQRQAQAEIDHVVGSQRLPTFADREKMPYIEAVLKESLRWNLVAPMALPHSALEESVHCGYLIPKGATIIANCWEFGHDPDTYVDPMTFKPERFLRLDGRESEMDPNNYAFGFGRRLCPGKEFADASMWLVIAMTLATLNITKARDATGSEITPVAEFHNGLICHPKDYKCAISPRSEKSAVLVWSIEEEHPCEMGDAKELEHVKWDTSESI